MSKDEKFDQIFLSLAQQLEGGVPQLMDVLFGFLRRKTDFFVGGESGAAQKMVLSAFEKNQNLALEEKKKRDAEEKKRKKEEEERKKKEEQEEKSRVVEITDEEEKELNAKKSSTKNESKTEIPKSEIPNISPAPQSSAPTISKSESSSAEDEGTGLIPNSGNGSQTDTYSWTQVLNELEARIKVPNGTKGRDLAIEIKSNKFKLGFKGKAPIVEGEWYKPIKVDDSYWTLEDGKTVVLHILKQNEMEWWGCLLKGEPEINTRKISPENSRLDDLDGETRATVEKMMFDQRQKQAGLPSSDELQKQELLKKFMQQHPEMDFSKAKIG